MFTSTWVREVGKGGLGGFTGGYSIPPARGTDDAALHLKHLSPRSTSSRTARGERAEEARCNSCCARVPRHACPLFLTARPPALAPPPPPLLQHSLRDSQVWGTLAYTTGTETITNERAIIMMGHVHALAVSVCATVAPLSFQDKLFLDVEAGEKDGPAPGLIPSFVPGLTPEAEIFNGRMAMMGLVVTATVALTTGQSFLEVVNAGLGGLLM